MFRAYKDVEEFFKDLDVKVGSDIWLFNKDGGKPIKTKITGFDVEDYEIKFKHFNIDLDQLFDYWIISTTGTKYREVGVIRTRSVFRLATADEK